MFAYSIAGYFSLLVSLSPVNSIQIFSKNGWKLVVCFYSSRSEHAIFNQTFCILPTKNIENNKHLKPFGNMLRN